jgi:hypothetical protein
VPWANGYADYLKLVNARDGGINGVKITFEECDTAYATDRGVECYERLKGKAQGGIFQPLSTGITFALTEKAPADKNPLITGGYGEVPKMGDSLLQTFNRDRNSTRYLESNLSRLKNAFANLAEDDTTPKPAP